MAKKEEAQRKIDVKKGRAAAPIGQLLATTESSVAPSVAAPPAPTSLAVGTMTLYRASAAALALVPLTWSPGGGSPPTRYVIEVATDSGFTNISARVTADAASGVLELPTSRTFYARVYAIYGAASSPASASVTFTTPADTTPAGPPTSASGSFLGAGDLVVTWTNPADENLRDVEIRIWESASKTTLYLTDYSASGAYTWTAARNRQAGSGTPDPAVYVELRSRTWAGVLGTSVVVGTITKAAPATPSGLATDFTGVDLVVTWTTAAEASSYRLTLDGVARTVIGGRYVLTYDQNRQEHSGTADPAITVSLVAVDSLDQVSAAPATATATNAAPGAPSAVTLTRGYSSFAVQATATEPADFLSYRYRIIQTSPAAGDVTIDSPSSLLTRETSVNATYQVGVRVVDLFGQTSAEVLSSATVVDAITLEEHRAGLTYTNSIGSSAGSLAALKDGVTASGGITYAA